MELLLRGRAGFVFDAICCEPALLIAYPKGGAADEVLSDVYFAILDLLSLPVEFEVSEKGSFERIPQMTEQARKAPEASYIGEDAVILHYSDRRSSKSLSEYPQEIEKALLNSLLEDSPSRSVTLIDEFLKQ